MSRPAISGQLFSVQRPGIALCRHFCPIVKIIAGTHRGQQPLHLPRRQQGGGTPAHKYGPHLMVCKTFCLFSDLPAQRLHIGLYGFLPGRRGKEIAVKALPFAERNVQIDPQLFFPVCLFHTLPSFAAFCPYFRSSSFSTLIKAFWGISTLPI